SVLVAADARTTGTNPPNTREVSWLARTRGSKRVLIHAERRPASYNLLYWLPVALHWNFSIYLRVLSKRGRVQKPERQEVWHANIPSPATGYRADRGYPDHRSAAATRRRSRGRYHRPANNRLLRQSHRTGLSDGVAR